MIRHFAWISFLLGLVSLTTLLAPKPGDPAQAIVDRAIRQHGGKKYDRVHVAFDFRQYRLSIRRPDGRFAYQRVYQDSLGSVITEEVTNEGFTRLINQYAQPLSEAEEQKYYDAVNATVYLSLLPYRLNDAGVIKQYLGKVLVKGKPCHKVRVSFAPENGGRDFQDVFYYWFDAKEYTLDYFAYGAGGNRFREAVNRRRIGGILFQDYVNYTQPEGDTTSLLHFDRLFGENKLVTLSKIQNRNVTVKPLR